MLFGAVLVLALVGWGMQLFGNACIGPRVVAAKLLQLPIVLLLVAALLVLSVGSFLFGVVCLVRPSFRLSWALIIFCLVEGGYLTLTVWQLYRRQCTKNTVIDTAP